MACGKHIAFSWQKNNANEYKVSVAPKESVVPARFQMVLLSLLSGVRLPTMQARGLLILLTWVLVQST